MAAAFFDLDRTVIADNSGLLYARWERRHGRISRRQLAQTVLWGGLYHFALVDLEAAFTRALSHYKGVEDAELRARTQAFFDSTVADLLLPGAAAAIAYHRERGEPTILLTNSSSYLAEAASAAFGLDHWLANRFTRDAEGRLDGHFEAPLCYGHGKVLRASAFAAERGIDLGRCTFYTDSLTDLPMLECVGQPRVVQPDPRLRRVARKRGWPILDWQQQPTDPPSRQSETLPSVHPVR